MDQGLMQRLFCLFGKHDLLLHIFLPKILSFSGRLLCKDKAEIRQVPIQPMPLNGISNAKFQWDFKFSKKKDVGILFGQPKSTFPI